MLNIKRFQKGQTKTNIIAIITAAVFGVMLMSGLVAPRQAEAHGHRNSPTLRQCAQYRPVLKVGVQGQAGCVAVVQGFLFWVEGFTVIGKVDGVFGEKTWWGVAGFQSKYGKKVDGIVGNQTWGRLMYNCDLRRQCDTRYRY